MNSLAASVPTPWYREPWPWILMAGPVAAVVAGAITVWIAVTHEDALVADDYYKQGLAINRTLDRQTAAATLGVEGHVMFGADGSRVRVFLKGEAVPARLTLHFAHATRAGLDQKIVLDRSEGGWYEAPIVPMRDGKWKVLLEDPAAAWRVSGIWQAGADDTLDLHSEAR